jgi:hypothetical protein
MPRVWIATCVATYVLLLLLSVDDVLLVIILVLRALRQLMRYAICYVVDTGHVDVIMPGILKVKLNVTTLLLMRLFDEALVRSEQETMMCSPFHADTGNATVSDDGGRPKK